MGQYKITTFFNDLHTGEAHEIGSVKEFTAERAKEILKAGDYIEAVPVVKSEPAAKSKPSKA